jgi:hypothetical protein
MCSTISNASDYNPGSYLIDKSDGLEIVYSKEHENNIKIVKTNLNTIIKYYEKIYGYKLDSVLKLGLGDSNNQLANAYSTQSPFNKQILFVGGTTYIDYFANVDWLRGLIVHETAHNFQMNPKENIVSKTAHKLTGNSVLLFLPYIPIPIFPIPNNFINSSIIEGNAILMESMINNGGRLYNGRFKAMVTMQAKSNLIQPHILYNNHISMPYGERPYMVGGYFQLYLAQKYGIEKTGKFFKNFSKQIFPFRVNSIFKNTYGNDYETELDLFQKQMKKDSIGFKKTVGKHIAYSQAIAPLNDNDENIIFLTTDHLSSPVMVEYNKKNSNISKHNGNWLFGKPFYIDGKYYTVGNTHIDTVRKKQGLFDSEGILLDGTESKVVQRKLTNGELLYFDSIKSVNSAILYKGDELIGKINSSAYSDDKNNIYYFKQSSKTRTLYKNKTKIFSFLGYSSHIVGVINNQIFFIAPSKYGTSLYSYNNGIYKMIDSDDVVDARIIDQNRALVVAVESDRYHFKEATISSVKSDIFEIKLFFEGKQDIVLGDKQSDISPSNYIPQKYLAFSSISPLVFTSDSKSGSTFDIGINFTDNISENNVKLFALKDIRKSTLGGIEYQNSQTRFKFHIKPFWVLDSGEYDSSLERNTTIYKDGDKLQTRDIGFSGDLLIPFYRSNYFNFNANIGHYIDYKKESKKPFFVSLEIVDKKQFGNSILANSLHKLVAFASDDRGDRYFGGQYKFQHDLFYETYISLSGKYVKNNKFSSSDKDLDKGIRVTKSINSLENDPTNIIMASADDDLFVKEISVLEASIYKVFNLSSYFFSFPLSLRREVLYIKHKKFNYSYLNIGDYDTVGDDKDSATENTFGLKGDFVMINNLIIPMSVEYIINKSARNKTRIKFFIGAKF